MGQMHPIGTRINTSGNKVPCRASSDASSIRLLSKAVVASSKLASVTIPGVLRVAQDLENDASMMALKGMEDDGILCYVTHSMDLIVNLFTSSHYDVNNVNGASQGFSIWTEERSGTTKSWYFVLPNMNGTFPDSEREYYGIAIKLTHGVLISWDGRLIRHCTSVMSRHGGNVFGTFFAAKTKVIKYGMLDAQREKEQKSSLGRGAVPDHGASAVSGVVMIGNCKVVTSIDSPIRDDDDCSASTFIEDSETEEEDDNDDDGSHDNGISDGGL
ncbi:hypothetical protein MHU86_75 [Fragilaria crotonensis]|nr:hypothetical protein MHU86_75 [Fragilaria crotonensis]